MKNAASLTVEIELLKQEVEEKDQQIDSKNIRIRHLEEMLQALRHKQFGSSSEKFSPGQKSLFNEAEEATDSIPDDSGISVPAHTRKKKRRASIPADYPREDIIHDIPDADKFCPHDGTALKCIGAESSEQMDIIPATIKVFRHLRQKYACPCCEKYLVTATKPPQPIEKSMASAGLLAYIATSKYVDGLPLYRLISIFKRMGIEMDRTTLANWMVKMGKLVQPLINRLLDIANEQFVLHMDETPLQVLNEPGKTPQSKSYMWLLATTQASVPLVLYYYSASRSSDTPSDLLTDFNGALMTDGYEGYNPLCVKNNLTRLGCWAHTRRKFIDAKRQQPKGKAGKADIALSFIQKLYAAEK
ncbi:MAG: IS66 family transposase, partial [Sinobacterium sp.]|nr:IS66 family transposase [Sinobacterium sp.]